MEPKFGKGDGKGTKEVQANVFVKYECKVKPNFVLL